MDTDPYGTETTTDEEAVPAKASRPPPIIPTSERKLIQLQKQLKSLVKNDFEFRSTRNGIRAITNGIADLETGKSLLWNNILSYYSFYQSPSSL
jgi:hypothetical protein